MGRSLTKMTFNRVQAECLSTAPFQIFLWIHQMSVYRENLQSSATYEGLGS